MVTRYQERALKKFAGRALGWERPANHPGISDKMFDDLVIMGYVEEKHEHGQRWVRLTEQGERAVFDDVWVC